MRRVAGSSGAACAEWQAARGPHAQSGRLLGGRMLFRAVARNPGVGPDSPVSGLVRCMKASSPSPITRTRRQRTEFVQSASDMSSAPGASLRRLWRQSRAAPSVVGTMWLFGAAPGAPWWDQTGAARADHPALHTCRFRRNLLFKHFRLALHTLRRTTRIRAGTPPSVRAGRASPQDRGCHLLIISISSEM